MISSTTMMPFWDGKQHFSEALLQTEQNETGLLIETPPETAAAVCALDGQTVDAKLSPESTRLLERTFRIRASIGKVPFDVTELVREMRDQGD